MNIKKTALLAEELQVIAETFPSSYVRGELLEAAKRLTDLERIAEFFRTEASRLSKKCRR
jgi:aminoglycoside N3'-acetyltransferase